MDDDLTGALRAGGAGARAASERAARGLAAAAERRGLLDVATATVDSPLGTLLAAGTPRGLVMLAYDDASRERASSASPATCRRGSSSRPRGSTPSAASSRSTSRGGGAASRCRSTGR